MSHRTKLPEPIEKEMQKFRKGWAPLPSSYIDFHKNLAKKRLDDLKENASLSVLQIEMRADGWLDGMYVLHAVVKTKTGNIKRISWHDGNQNFMLDTGRGRMLLQYGDLDENVEIGERVVNVLTGETTNIPKGWSWDNWMEFLHG